jgi:hypothetical protein
LLAKIFTNEYISKNIVLTESNILVTGFYNLKDMLFPAKIFSEKYIPKRRGYNKAQTNDIYGIFKPKKCAYFPVKKVSFKHNFACFMARLKIWMTGIFIHKNVYIFLLKTFIRQN